MESKFEKWLLRNGWNQLERVNDLRYSNPDTFKSIYFKNGLLLFPKPQIKEGYKFKSDQETIQKAINKYSYESVVESMFNPKVILTL